MASHLRRIKRIDEIAKVSPPSRGWSHSGMVILSDGVLVFAHPEGRRLIFHDPHKGSWMIKETGLLEIHGITRDPKSESVLWLADPGMKPAPENAYRDENAAGRVLSWDIRTGKIAELSQPSIDAYAYATWRPTSVAVDSSGLIWVADGYGASLVHAFSAAGQHVFSLDGTESGLRFNCPHGILVSAAGTYCASEVYIADRGNRRIVVFGQDGTFHRVVTGDEMTSPSCLAAFDGVIFVTDLFGGLLQIEHGRKVSAIIQAPQQQPPPPWPNGGTLDSLHTPNLDPVTLHSPHGIATDAEGRLYITEWCIGGRQLRLVLNERQSS